MSKYTCFADLPQNLKSRIKRLNQPNLEKWISQKIPALGNKSILETMNEENGHNKIYDYLLKVEGKFMF
jgi:hypothetical protein